MIVDYLILVRGPNQKRGGSITGLPLDCL